MLHAALADDAGFLRRFGAEAQRPPRSTTPTSWPSTTGATTTAAPFMVLELLEGGSLAASSTGATG